MAIITLTDGIPSPISTTLRGINIIYSPIAGDSLRAISSDLSELEFSPGYIDVAWTFYSNNSLTISNGSVIERIQLAPLTTSFIIPASWGTRTQPANLPVVARSIIGRQSLQARGNLVIMIDVA